MTVTVNDAVDSKPALFVAVQFTVVVVIANVEPDAGTQPTGSVPSAKSVAVGFVYVTTAPEAPVASVVISDGTPLIVGAVSVTVTVNVAVVSLPLLPTAVHVTVVVLIANVEPDAGVQPNDVTVVSGAAVADAV